MIKLARSRLGVKATKYIRNLTGSTARARRDQVIDAAALVNKVDSVPGIVRKPLQLLGKGYARLGLKPTNKVTQGLRDMGTAHNNLSAALSRYHAAGKATLKTRFLTGTGIGGLSAVHLTSRSKPEPNYLVNRPAHQLPVNRPIQQFPVNNYEQGIIR